MRTIRVTDDLSIEVWPADGDGEALVKLRSAALERDGEVRPGQVIVYASEIRYLMAALVDAVGVIADWAGWPCED